MASNMYALKCPCCGRSAFEDYYYKSGERYTFCIRCGYNYSKTIVSYTGNRIAYKEEQLDGHGVLKLVDKDGSRKTMMLNSCITEEEFKKYKTLFMDVNVNQEESYLVSFKEGVFTILLGNPSANFHLSFEEYREKMFSKYGIPEYDFMVPMDE